MTTASGSETLSRDDGYAAALLEVARAEGAIDRVVDELFRFARALEENDKLREALTNAELPPEKRQAIVEDILGSRAYPLTVAMVSFVIAAGRSREMGTIIDRLVEKSASEREHELAEVRSSVELEPEVTERLEQALSKKLGKQVEVKVIVDRSVMGGLIAKVGDTVIDGSVRHRLEKLKEVL